MEAVFLQTDHRWVRLHLPAFMLSILELFQKILINKFIFLTFVSNCNHKKWMFRRMNFQNWNQ